MTTFATPYSPLIETFDAIGWVPTIRGGLSLNVFDNSNSLLGDVDKFSTEVKTYDGFTSSRYLVASSLFTFDDSKKGNQYRRTFRFIFRGTINDAVRQNDFISKKFNNEETVKALFEEKGLLIGKISIIATLSNRLTTKEKQLLQLLENLSATKKKYNIACNVNAKSCEVLAALREELKTEWEEVEKKIIDIESGVDENPIYKFDVVLSRDGILFLKDDTCPKFLSDFYKENTQSDYKKNIPIHRIFKTAMNFIKYLFHMNYHHGEEHDTFLPATNLHPIKKDKNLSRMVKHQIEAFLSPITKMKRGDNGYYNQYNLCNSEGVLSYAEAFLLICKSNKFLPEEEVALLLNFIEKQKKEFEVLISDKKVVRNFFLSQKNLFATLTIALSILITVTRTFDFLFRDSDFLLYLNSLGRDKVFMIRLYIIVGSFVSAVLLHKNYVNWQIFTGKFNRKKKGKKICNQNSNIDKGRFSILYIIRLYLMNYITCLVANWFFVVLMMVFIVITSLLWWLSYQFLIH